MTEINPSGNTSARLWARVERTTTCWLWQGAKTDQGYGHMSVSNTLVYVHRLAYQLLRGPIPEGMQLDHICRVRHCVNPAHLEPVPPRVNTLRGISPLAINARKTHCVHGHEFTPENTVQEGPRKRRCRECRRQYDANRVPRRRATR